MFNHSRVSVLGLEKLKTTFNCCLVKNMEIFQKPG